MNEPLTVEPFYDASLEGGADGLVAIRVPGTTILVSVEMSRQLRKELTWAEDVIVQGQTLTGADAELLRVPAGGMA